MRLKGTTCGKAAKIRWRRIGPADDEMYLQKAAAHRDFAEVKRVMHDVHGMLFERMPLIPLWQFDRHVAVHASLTLPPLDPERIFCNIDEWKLRTP